MRNFLIVVLCLIFSSGALAQSPGWTSPGKITKIYTKPSRQGVYIVHEKMNAGPCIGSSSAFYFLDGSSDSVLFKETYALLLAAFMSSKPVDLYLKDCQATHNYPLVTEVIISGL